SGDPRHRWLRPVPRQPCDAGASVGDGESHERGLLNADAPQHVSAESRTDGRADGADDGGGGEGCGAGGGARGGGAVGRGLNACPSFRRDAQRSASWGRQKRSAARRGETKSVKTRAPEREPVSYTVRTGDP